MFHQCKDLKILGWIVEWNILLWLLSNIVPYSRYQHSIGVALIVYHFTHDLRQTVAGLLHDIATPVFAHTIDFFHQDHLKQESTELDTKKVIEQDTVLVSLLHKYHLTIEDVCNYHLYPLADNEIS